MRRPRLPGSFAAARQKKSRPKAAQKLPVASIDSPMPRRAVIRFLPLEDHSYAPHSSLKATGMTSSYHDLGEGINCNMGSTFRSGQSLEERLAGGRPNSLGPQQLELLDIAFEVDRAAGHAKQGLHGNVGRA